jgi:hypothetical protein
VKHLVLLLVLLSGGFFLWRFVLNPWQKHITGTWGRRVVAAVLFAAVAAIGLFTVLSSTTWRFF